MIERGAALGLADLACDIAGLLSERDPLRAQGMQRDPDLRHRVDVLRGAPAPAGFAVDGRALQQVRRSSELFARRISRDDAARTHGQPQLARDQAVGLLLAFAYPDRIGMARGGEGGRYLLSQGRGAALPGPSALARSEFIVAAEIDAGEREAKLYLAAPLERALLEQHFGALITEQDEVAWDAADGCRHCASGAAPGCAGARRTRHCAAESKPIRARRCSRAFAHSGSTACRGRRICSNGGRGSPWYATARRHRNRPPNGPTCRTPRCLRRSKTGSRRGSMA